MLKEQIKTDFSFETMILKLISTLLNVSNLFQIRRQYFFTPTSALL